MILHDATVQSRDSGLRLLSIGLALTLVGCGGGIYGYARSYEALGAEEAQLTEATVPPYEEVRRFGDRNPDALIGWFGVVRALDDAGEGRMWLTLDLRRHQERHLCRDEQASSCRVTVSERSLGVFVANVALRPEELSGQDRLSPGSLVKIYGRLMPEGTEGPESASLAVAEEPSEEGAASSEGEVSERAVDQDATSTDTSSMDAPSTIPDPALIPMLMAAYHRHWPRHSYATSADAIHLRY